MRTSFHHQPEAQHPNFQLSTSWQADYPIFGSFSIESARFTPAPLPLCPESRLLRLAWRRWVFRSP